MKISKETLEILANFATINSSIFIREGNVLKTKSTMENFGAKATVEETFPTDFAVYALADLLSLIKLFDEPEVEFGENSLTLVSEKGGKIVYHYTDPVLIDEAKMNVPSYDTVFSFEMTESDIKMIHKTASILGANTLSFIGDGSVVQLVVSDQSSDGTNSYKKELGESDEVFAFHVVLDSFKVISDSYEVKLASKKFLHFISTTRELDYVVAVTPKSTLG